MTRFTPYISKRLRRPALACLTGLALGALVLPLGGCADKPPEEKLDEALLLLQEGKIARGVLQLKDLVDKNPEDPAALEAYLTLGNYYLSEGSFAQAVRHFDPVLEGLDITDERALAALDGKLAALMSEQDVEGSLAAVDEALEDAPEDDVDLQFAIERKKADVLLASGAQNEENAEAGRAILTRMMTELEAPYRHVAREHLANYYRQMLGEFEKSNEVYRVYLEAHPDDELRPRLEMAMGVNLRLADKRDEGLEIFTPAAAQLMEEADAVTDDQELRNQLLSEVAQNYRMMGLYDEAEETMRTIMGENVRSMLAIQMQFAISEMTIRDRGELDRGLELLNQIARENPDSSIAETANRYITAVEQAQAQMQAAEEAAAAAEGAAPEQTEAETGAEEAPADAEPSPAEND